MEVARANLRTFAVGVSCLTLLPADASNNLRTFEVDCWPRAGERHAQPDQRKMRRAT